MIRWLVYDNVIGSMSHDIYILAIFNITDNSRGAVGMIQIDENLFTEDYLHDDEELINGVTDELKVDEELFDVDEDELLILEEELQEIENAGDSDKQSVGSD